jgi:hypothetical protein
MVTEPEPGWTEEFNAVCASRVVAYPPPSGIVRICSSTSALKSEARAKRPPVSMAADKIERV